MVLKQLVQQFHAYDFDRTCCPQPTTANCRENGIVRWPTPVIGFLTETLPGICAIAAWTDIVVSPQGQELAGWGLSGMPRSDGNATACPGRHAARRNERRVKEKE